MPYKEKIFELLPSGDNLTKFAQSANLIVKQNKNLYCYNTDIVGALNTIKNTKKKNIVIFGLGGTGKPIFKVLYKKFKSNFFLISSKNHKKFSNLKNVVIKKKIDSSTLEKTDLFINCSPLGSSLKKGLLKKSPLTEEQVQHLNKKSLVFDIVYNPKSTMLGKYCKKNKVKFVNGIKMNTVQAEIALIKIHKTYRKLQN